MNTTQLRIKNYIGLFNSKNTTPTTRQIAAYIGRSVSTTHAAVMELERRGHITRQGYKANAPRIKGSMMVRRVE